jgi:hypothetical protein
MEPRRWPAAPRRRRLGGPFPATLRELAEQRQEVADLLTVEAITLATA